MNTKRIAIIDVLGLSFDGSSLKKKGLGGSESAIILIADELSKIGFDVDIYNDCTSDDSMPGLYGNVRYYPLNEIDKSVTEYDILIGSRSVAIFVDDNDKKYIKNGTNLPDFSRIVAKKKILWLHDTFCDGDHLVEKLVNDGKIDEIFTLSDFHTSYITNCDHGNRRNFEVLKNKVFQTRNGIVRHIDWVDIKKKDKNLFVYNASATKGMVPLVERIWPRIKQLIPDAKLTIIGGYYNFRSNEGPDEQQKCVVDLVKKYGDSINFTGVIKQCDIAQILAEASFMIYPAAFPETFGISSLESLNYNTPILTCRFGALEETAIDLACYKIPYAIEPNNLFPSISSEDQENKFVDMVYNAYYNTYLHQQKMYACNQVKNISTWDTVALQWKQHFYKILDDYLPVEEYRKVCKINYNVSRIFGRRFSNMEELREIRNNQNKIVIISPVYNAEKYIEKCIKSVASQDYNNYKMIIIDDCSTDNTYQMILKTLDSLSDDKRKLFSIHQNYENMGAVFNQVNQIQQIHDDSIVILLDGDDWLKNDPCIFHRINNLYREGAEFTYGSCWSVIDNIPLISQEYPPEVKLNRDYRNYKFNWNIPYTHLRTFKSSLFDIKDFSVFKDSDGKWLKAGGDTSLFYELIERANPDNVICISDILMYYNDANPICDYKINSHEQTKTANMVMSKNNMKKKILIAIPTAKNIETDTFKSIYDLIIPDGYEVDFQYFYGYSIDQIRNLIASWSVNNNYDYLFSVDHDIKFDTDTLKKLLSHDKDIVTGIYRQRLEREILEIYDFSYNNISYNDLSDFQKVGACGFGCVLVKTSVFSKMGYPQFLYQHALDHKDTFSEDLYFCRKARECGFDLWVDSTVICDHIGDRVFSIDTTNKKLSTLDRFRELGSQRLLPIEHRDFLNNMEYKPSVVFDIGACVLHWTREAQLAWPDAKIIPFEAMTEVAEYYLESGYDQYGVGALGSEQDKIVDMYINTEHPGGNSIFKENPKMSPRATELFPESSRRKYQIWTLDNVMAVMGYPQPDLIKMDVQGSELDILKGASKTLEKCDHLILELQHRNYNMGAPIVDEVIEYLKDLGYECKGRFCGTHVDGDYYFVRTHQDQIHQ